ncbi:IgA FC receptor [Pandoraea pneumonica]|uniref:IgA FC receptor n=1 Tax=Pandoraea pneumonica TaxID=2508299 RepID=A0A5E4S8P7_9BURK|nr:hypothetical protein [Pandoraea pneumonica]VVD70944.1 IgA FC receptor [Pandoraea pneumonica]
MKKPQHGGWGRVALMSVAALALGGCAISPNTQISSVRSPDYKAPHVLRVFVVYDEDMRFGKEFGDGFRKEMTGRLASCGIESKFGVIKTLTLDTRDVRREMELFQPQISLRVQPNGGVVQGSLPLRVDFVTDAIDNARDATVWRGVFQVHHVGTLYVSYFERGGVFATELVNRLITDNIIDACPILPLDPGNRLPKRGTVTGAPTSPTTPATAKAPTVPSAPNAANSAAGAPTPPKAQAPKVAGPAAPTTPPTPSALPAVPVKPANAATPAAPPATAKTAEPPPPPLADDTRYLPKRAVSIDDLKGLLPPAQ